MPLRKMRFQPREKAFATSGTCERIDCVGVGDVREAEILQRAVDDPVLEHATLDERPALGRTLV